MEDKKTPYVFNEGEFVEEGDEVVGNVADQEIDMTTAIEEATKEQSNFLKVDELDKTGMTVIEIIEVPDKAYKKAFGSNVVTRADLIVKAKNGKTKGEVYKMSIGRYNLRKLANLFGKEYSKWKNKKVILSKETRGNYTFISVSNEYKPIDE